MYVYCMYAQPAAELRPHMPGPHAPAHCLLSQSSLAMLRASTWSYLLLTCLAKPEHSHSFSRGTIAYKYCTSYLFFSSVARRGSPPFIKAASVRSRMDALVTVSHMTAMFAIWEERWHMCGGSDLHRSKSTKSQFLFAECQASKFLRRR